MEVSAPPVQWYGTHRRYVKAYVSHNLYDGGWSLVLHPH
jgi:hypothetical protein